MAAARRRLRTLATLCAAGSILTGCSVLGLGGAPVDPQVEVRRTAEDSRIRQDVERRLAAEPSIGAAQIRVVVTGGEVQLHGSVAGFGALQCAMTNAELVPGVVLVIDFLVLEPGPRSVRCLATRSS